MGTLNLVKHNRIMKGKGTLFTLSLFIKSRTFYANGSLSPMKKARRKLIYNFFDYVDEGWPWVVHFFLFLPFVCVSLTEQITNPAKKYGTRRTLLE